MSPKNSPIFVLLVVAFFVLLVGVACGGNGCGDTVSMDDPACQPTATADTRPAFDKVGQFLYDNLECDQSKGYCANTPTAQP